MAGLKKSSRKRDTSSPNLVLIIFLVFFVLVSLGLGIWGYYGYAGQEKLAADAKTAKKVADAAQLGEAFWRTAALDAELAGGQPLDADKLVDLKNNREELLKENGKFDKEQNRDAIKKAMEENKKLLGFNEAEGKYVDTYPNKFVQLKAALDAKTGEVARITAEKSKIETRMNDLQAAQDKHHKAVVDDIAKGNATALAESRKGTAANAGLIEQNNKLVKQIGDNETEHQKQRLALERRIRERDQKIAELEQKRTEVVSATRNANDVHALLLDVSSGKPLWDQPRGKVIRVDMGKRQVVINLGSADGVQPELTFSVFGAGAYGGAEKHLKGTLEVVRVLDAHTAMTRITSLYDAEGHEVSLSDQSLTRIQRESEAALREGDLLFNMFWGNRVAIAGAASLAGGYTDSPAEQMRRLTEFSYFVERQGMPLDAWIDLADGQIKGTMTWKTRYLILGGELHTDEKGPQAERAKQINEAIAGMKKDAAEKGLFIISAENFLNVVGYRAPRGSGAQEVAGFRPSQLKAGTPLPGLYIPGRTGPANPFAEPAAPPAPAEEKKAMEKKEEEK